MLKNIKRVVIVSLMLFIFSPMVFAQEPKEPDWIRKRKEENKKRLPELIEQLRKAKTIGDIGERLIWDIGETGDPRIVEPLIEVIESDDSIKFSNIHYIHAAKFLGEMKAKKAIPALKSRLLKEKDSNSRYRQSIAVAVAIALYQLGELYTALPVMREFINKEYIEYDNSPHGNRPYKLEDIVAIPLDIYKHDTTATRLIHDLLRDATKNRDEQLKVGAAKQLVTIDKQLAFMTAVEVLEEDTKGRPGWIIFPAKEQALYILGEIGDEASIRILNEFKKNPDEHLRWTAEKALEKSKGRRK